MDIMHSYGNNYRQTLRKLFCPIEYHIDVLLLF